MANKSPKLVLQPKPKKWDGSNGKITMQAVAIKLSWLYLPQGDMFQRQC